MIEDSKLQERYAREEQKMGNENDEPNSAEVDADGQVMRTPDEWCRIKQIQILDADGWRGHDAKDWDEPLTELDFEERAMVCTQRSVEGITTRELGGLDSVLIAGSITTPGGMTIGALIDPVLAAGPPRYRIWDGMHHFDEIEAHWSRESVVAMARGLAAVSRNRVRLVEISETATEIQFDKGASA